MARQTGDTLLYGTRYDGNGYIDGKGRVVFRLKPGPSREAWKRKKAFARTRAAAAEFGKVVDELGRLWRLVPKRMRLLCGEFGWQEAVRGASCEGRGASDKGLGRMGGLDLCKDAVDLGVGLELEAKGADGERTLHDFVSMGSGWPSAVRVWGLKEELEALFECDEAWRPFDGLPVAGHHVTGGTGEARSKQRKRVVARYWNSGKGLEDRRELEHEKWDAVARGKGFVDAKAWFRAMKLGASDEWRVASLEVEDVRVKVHLCVVNVGGDHHHLTRGSPLTPPRRGSSGEPRQYSEGEWMTVRELHRVRIPHAGAGMVFLGLEFGYVRNGVLLPLACLNRLWCLGNWGEGVARDEGRVARISRVKRAKRREKVPMMSVNRAPVRIRVRGPVILRVQSLAAISTEEPCGEMVSGIRAGP